MNTLRVSSRAVILLSALAILGIPLRAQGTSSLRGVVLDPQNASVVGALQDRHVSEAIDGVRPNLVSKGEVPYDAGSNENQRERAGHHGNRGTRVCMIPTSQLRNRQLASNVELVV